MISVDRKLKVPIYTKIAFALEIIDVLGYQ